MFVQRHTVHLLTVSGCTIHMATLLLKGVCCRSAYQADWRAVCDYGFSLFKEELLVDNLDTVEVR